MKRICITGGAGFIGSNLAERLHGDVELVLFDNFSTGRREFVADVRRRGRVMLVNGDVLDIAALERAFAGCDWVFHLQANADVRRGFEHPRRDLEQNTIATANVLQAMRATHVRRIAFASTAPVYGEPEVFPTPEDAPFPVQTSLYGASKLAAEGLIAAYAAGYGFTGLIFRLVSVLGEHYTHGHVFDFYRALRREPTRLRVHGDGRQEKSYLYVGDCVDAFVTALTHHRRDSGVHIYNLGTDETLRVADSVRIVSECMSLSPAVEYEGGRRGWTGDSPLVYLDTARMRSLGWEPKLTIEQAVVRTVRWLAANEALWSEQGGDTRSAGDRAAGSPRELIP
ncbi:MAG TPA: NAD-dependent epimerase/dehydratase family protein [Solirubrobacteraceae bacterium]|nr:NAD-dependent epimerase/dehydratase family protein [Solirubrobacteraceae bacterium]